MRRLRSRGHEVRCALTRSAVSFVTPLTLEVLTGRPVYQEEYLTATGTGEEAHITAAAWAEVLCVAPATTNVLARLALGLGDDFLTTTALAFSGPVVVAPAMHLSMWDRETTRQHVETLRRRGVWFAGPVEGPLASGEVGMGRMAEPEAIAPRWRPLPAPGRSRAARCWSPPGPPMSRSIPSASWATARAGGWASRSPPKRRGAAPGWCWSRARCRSRLRPA